MSDPKQTSPNGPNSPTQERPTTSEGDPVDGTGEDNHAPTTEKRPAGKTSPQQEHNDEDHG